MKTLRILGVLIILFVIHPVRLRGQEVKPETLREFDAYVKIVEERMTAEKVFQRADADTALRDQLLHGKIQTYPANGANPHKIAKGQLYDWIGAIFIPEAKLERTVQMLQDYDHRAQYFSEILASSKLLCHTGLEHFRFTMRLKEPAVIDTENDVVWERLDARHWRCRSYSTKVQEVGKQHGYLQRLYSYWRFAEAEKGVLVQAETITLSGEFSSITRALGSMVGISPEKSLRKSLVSMRETMSKPGLEFAKPADGLPECGEPFRPGPVPVTQR